MRRRFRAVLPIATLAALLVPFALAVGGCDGFRRTRHPHRGAAISDEDGGDIEEGGAPPGPTFTAEPGDIQL